VNITEILEDSNHNLTGGQKLLLEWHYRFAHLNFQALQSLLRRVPFVAKRFAAAVKFAPPKCEVCELAKAKRRAKKAETKTKNPERDGVSRQITSVQDYEFLWTILNAGNALYRVGNYI
jgi:hypothetical protein